MGSEAASFQEATRDVVGELAKAHGGTAEVFEAAMDGLGGSVAGAGSVEVRQHVRSETLQRPPERAGLAQGTGNAGADRVDQGLYHCAALGSVGFAVGGDHALVGPQVASTWTCFGFSNRAAIRACCLSVTN